MSPAPAVAVRNTSTATEGEIIMTDEELQQRIQEVSEGIDELSDPDKPLTKKEKRRQQVLLLKKETLERIRLAKEKGDSNQELTLGMSYSLLESYGEKHPILLRIMSAKMRTIFIT